MDPLEDLIQQICDMKNNLFKPDLLFIDPKKLQEIITENSWITPKNNGAEIDTLLGL